MTIGQAIKDARTRQALTVQQLDELSGVPASTIRRIESDSNDPAYSAVTSLCRALGLSMDTLTDSTPTDVQPLVSLSETVIAYRMHVSTLRHQLRVTTLILICLIAFILGILIIDLMIPTAGWIRRTAAGIRYAVNSFC